VWAGRGPRGRNRLPVRSSRLTARTSGIAPTLVVTASLMGLHRVVRQASFGPRSRNIVVQPRRRYRNLKLQVYCLSPADRDAIGDAFEVFIGFALRGAEGQFFTPRNVVRTVMAMVNPQPGEMVIDPGLRL
jgi:hypothetical protein